MEIKIETVTHFIVQAMGKGPKSCGQWVDFHICKTEALALAHFAEWLLEQNSNDWDVRVIKKTVQTRTEIEIKDA